MGREFPTAEEEFELSLELSIGGCYAKSESRSLERETRAPSEGDDGSREIPRSDFSCEIDAAAENGCDFSDLQKRREMHAMKRREARMKREFKKSRGMSGGGGFVEDRANLEFHVRAEERERREREGIPEELARKREKSSNASPLGENKVSYERQAQFVLPAVGKGSACPWVVPMWGSNVVAGERDERNSGEDPPGNVAARSWSGRRSSSAVSHHRSTSLKVSGGSSSDTGSHSSSFGTHHTDKVEQLELHNSSSLIGSMEKVTPSPSIQQQQQQQSSTSKSVEGSKIHAHSSLTGNTCATTEKPSSSSPTSTPPKVVSDGSGSGLQMPCVSTTGNGPNGRTITGFLHKYTKSEVSIMCVCHGSFFSPAGFVEHAGGVDIKHPLRHITVVPSLVR